MPVIAGLCILAVTPPLSLWSLPIREIYPSYLVWGRSVVRLAIAALLYALRPAGDELETGREFLNNAGDLGSRILRG